MQVHILVSFLAWLLWKTLAQGCQPPASAMNLTRSSPKLQRISSVDLVLPVRVGVLTRKRSVSRPPNFR